VAREELLSLDGPIDEIQPEGRFQVRLETSVSIIADTASPNRRGRIRSVIDDQAWTRHR